METTDVAADPAWKEKKGWTKQFLIGQIFMCLTFFYFGKMMTAKTTKTPTPTTAAFAFGSVITAEKQLGIQCDTILSECATDALATGTDIEQGVKFKSCIASYYDCRGWS